MNNSGTNNYDLFGNLDRLAGDEPVTTREHIVKAPFSYVGGKSRSAKTILKHLPLRGRYVEVFGGSAVVLINKEKEKFEVYNDRYSGLVDFYNCIKNKDLLQRMIDYLEGTLYSREDFLKAKKICCTSTDVVIRAANWYYKTALSFGSLGRNFARSYTNSDNKILNKLKHFETIHNRFKHVLVENLDWKVCMDDFDHPDTVFYLDPPYLETTGQEYAYSMTEADHEMLCNKIFDMEGFVALSGYRNKIYDAYDWDDIIEWEVSISIDSCAYTESNHLKERENCSRGYRTECLFIKR